MNYEIIQTGSDGNCTVVENAIAVDIGVAWYRLERFFAFRLVGKRSNISFR